MYDKKKKNVILSIGYDTMIFKTQQPIAQAEILLRMCVVIE
jgi:hypothetical protein